MVARQQVDGTGTRISRRQALVGTGTLALAATGSAAPWALALAAPSYSAATFKPYIGQGFLVTGDNVNTALRLVNVKTYARGNRPPSLPAPFSLIFRDFGGSEALPAELVAIEHAGIGKIVVYLNPITKDPSYYEVAFN